MAKRLWLPLAALMAASLLLAPVFTASASAHPATRVETTQRYVCDYVYVPEYLAYDAVCEWRNVTRTVNRWHIHTTERFCFWVTVASGAAGATVGTAVGGGYGAVIGGAAGSVAGYEVCRSLPTIVWLS